MGRVTQVTVELTRTPSDEESRGYGLRLFRPIHRGVGLPPMKSRSDLAYRDAKLFGAMISGPTGGRVLPANRADLLTAAWMVDAADRCATSRAPRMDHRRDWRYSMPARPL